MEIESRRVTSVEIFLARKLVSFELRLIPMTTVSREKGSVYGAYILAIRASYVQLILIFDSGKSFATSAMCFALDKPFFFPTCFPNDSNRLSPFLRKINYESNLSNNFKLINHRA